VLVFAACGVAWPGTDAPAAQTYEDAAKDAVLGALYDTGTGVAKDAAKATALYRRACAGGLTHVCQALKRTQR